MRFGLFTSMGAQTWSGVLDFWRQLESTGWDIACVTDHFMPNTVEREGKSAGMSAPAAIRTWRASLAVRTPLATER